MKIFRTYNTLRLVGKSKENELQKLGEEGKDFEYRRLLIEDTETALHVTFSRGVISKYLSWTFLYFAIMMIFFSLFKISLILGVISIIFQIIRSFYKFRFDKIIQVTLNTLLIIDHVIENRHGITMPKYL